MTENKTVSKVNATTVLNVIKILSIVDGVYVMGLLYFCPFHFSYYVLPVSLILVAAFVVSCIRDK